MDPVFLFARSVRKPSLAACALILFSAACGGPTAPSEVVSSLTLTAPSLIYMGQGSAMQAVAFHPDGTPRDVTNLATWTSSSGSVATASAAGVVTGVAGGTTTITVIYEGKSATANVQVFPTPVTGPSSVAVSINGSSFVAPSVTLGQFVGAGYADVSASSVTDLIVLHVVCVRTPGVYDVTSSPAVGNMFLVFPDGLYTADGLGRGGFGTITVVNVTPNRISGTFTGTLNGFQGTIGTKTLTNGVFDVLF